MIRKFGALISLVLIAAGIVCIIYKVQIANIIAVVAGAMVLVIGGFYTLSGFFARKHDSSYIWKFVLGILLIILGLYMIFNSHITISIVGVFIGLIAFIAGLDRFRTAYVRVKEKENPVAAVVMGIIHVVFGVGMCIIPSYGVSMLVLFMGVYLLSAGVMVLMSAIKFGDL